MPLTLKTFAQPYTETEEEVTEFLDTTVPALAVFAIEAGAGITDGVGTIYRSSVSRAGAIVTTQILIDLTGCSSATSDLDVIGVGTSAAHLGQITVAQNGILMSGTLSCLQLPSTLTDIDLYSATEATGVFEDNESTLTATALVTKGGAWSAGDIDPLTAIPAADEYLYFVNGTSDTADPFVAGQFLIELIGYDA